VNVHLYCIVSIGEREYILLRGRKKCALKITICPETNFLVYSEFGLKPPVNLFYIVEFVYNGFVGNVNSPITLHFVRSQWHRLLYMHFNSLMTSIRQ